MSLKFIVGTQFSRGISGGERKRVSIAVELLTAPRNTFIDRHLLCKQYFLLMSQLLD